MALQNSGPISLSQIASEFNDTAPHSLSEQYSAAPGIPSSGSISFSQFYGKSNSVAATGGAYVVTPGNGYKYHTFTGPGTFAVSNAGVVDILVVAAGGGSAELYDSRAGGAGGGGVAYWPSVSLPAQSYSITVGSGVAEANGGDSVFGPGTSYSVLAKGGGAGGGGPRDNQVAASNGGSGGGGSGFNQNTNSGTATQPSQNPGRSGLINYGNDGGPSRAPFNGTATAEGGGGAGGAGNRTTATYGATGGHGVQIASGAFAGSLIGIPSINPYSGYYGGGGDSSDSQNTTRPLGGGGACPHSSPVANHNGQAGVNYTGGGASGGGTGGFTTIPGNAGGHGIVVVRYAV